MTASISRRTPRGVRSILLLLPGPTLAALFPVAASIVLGTQFETRVQSVCGPGLVLEDSARLIQRLRPELGARAARAWTDRVGPQVCVPRELPRSFAARRMDGEGGLDPRAGTPPSAHREALRRKSELMSVQPKTVNAGGAWEAYGTGPLITNDPRYASVKYLGLVKTSGRVDSFAYDPVGQRLFATIGTGGVWASTDLGETWSSVGDGLPTQAVGAVAWSAADGGTLIVGSGEPLFGGGGSVFTGLGAFWSADLGATWHQATGIPDGAMTFEVVVDESTPSIVYVATTKGLYRSTDAGHSFTNVALPTSTACAGNNDGACEQANVVTDVVIRQPGGSTGATCAAQGCPVLAVVGHIASNVLQYRDGPANTLGTAASPGNGLYRSSTGEPGSFTLLSDPTWTGLTNVGFPPRERIGRTELGASTGPAQDHNYVYAIVQDAVLLMGGLPILDVPLQRGTQGVPSPTYLNGLYVSPDFGTTWTRLADTAEIAENPNTGSYFATSNAPLRAGFQAWYDEWIEADPTRAYSDGTPTRLLFGLEEVWANRVAPGAAVPQNGLAQSGADDYKVIGVYFAGESCVVTPFPACTGRGLDVYTTTHPDQHDAIFVPRDDGGVCLFVGNDGGVYRQCVGPDEEFSNQNWGDGHNEGFNTLLAYNIAAAKDGTVWFGLQDNGSGKIEGDTRKHVQAFGGDGFFAAVDPDNSLVAYTEYVNADMRATTDGGKTWVDLSPPVTAPQFSNPFMMDPTDPLHLITAGPEVVETLDGPDTAGSSWVEVFNLGTVPDDDTVAKTMTAVALHGANAYVAACGRCDGFLARGDRPFKAWLATNVGGSAPPQKASPDGWHFATAAGLPDRYVTGIAIDPENPATVYVTLGGYGGPHYLPPGRYLDGNANIGTGNVYKSVDAGENFTDISGSLDALRLPAIQASAVLLHQGQLVVGTDVGAFISQDTSGTGWAPLGAGLPAVPVVSLQVHPGNADLLLAGTYGRGVWCYSFSGDPDACDPPPLPPELVAPVQLDPLVEALDAGCSTDTNGAFAINFSYATPAGGVDPTGFQIQEGTQFGNAFTDDGEEALSGGANSKWVATGAWTSAPYTNGTQAYYAPATMDQSDTLTMVDSVTLASGGGTLSFDTTQSTEACCDFTFVEISTDGGVNFSELASWSGDFVPERRTLDLSAYANQSIKLRFRIAADALQGGPGWFIDNIVVETNDFATVAETGAGATTQALDGRTNGQRYYRVGATYALPDRVVAGPFSNIRCVTVTLDNLPPVVDVAAGYDLDEGASGLLSGTASDPESGALTYAWSQLSPPAPTATIDNPDMASTSFTAPAVDADTPITFRLTVTDDQGASATGDVVMNVRDVAGGTGTGTGPIGDNSPGGALPPWTLLGLALAALRRRDRRRHAAPATLPYVCAALALSLPLTALGATPATGTLTPTSGPISFQSGPFTSANSTPVPLLDSGPTCDDPAPACDHFELTISLPAGYVAAHNQDWVRVTTEWTDSGSGSSDYDLWIYRGVVTATDGGDTPPYSGDGTTNPEVAQVFPLADGDSVYTIKIVPYTPSGEVVTTTIELISADAVVVDPNFGKPDPVVPNAPRYRNYTPHPISAEAGNGECNIGFNPKTFRVMLMCFGDGSVYRVTTPERVAEPLPEACPAQWEDVTPVATSGPQPVADPILFTDGISGRTWASNLTLGPNVSYAYTDDDGDNWINAGGGAIVGADHQTIGSGPYPASFTGPHPLHENAVYFCSQDLVGPAGCARSDDGGATYTFNQPLVYTGAVCGGLHGHVRVAPNGTVWLPVEVCGTGTGYALSKDAGVTWTDHQLPGTSGTVGSDPSIALDAASRAYFCFSDGDGHIKVATSDDEGVSWRDVTDLGLAHGLKNTAFPEAWAGDSGRAACAFYGTNLQGNMQSLDFPGLWYAFVAHTYDAGRTWTTSLITPNDPIQGIGGIWQSGGGNPNRNLLDFNEVTMDDQGRLLFGYDDGCVRDCAKAPLENPQSFTAMITLARQTGGKRLVAAHDVPEPHAPGNACLSGKRTQARATLTWIEPDHGGAPIANYRVFRSTSPDGPLTFIGDAGPKAGYVDTSVDPNEPKYYYTVTAVNSVGESIDSNKIELVVVPEVIENLCVLPGLTFLTDATGDFDTSLAPDSGQPYHDLLLLQVAQPPVTDGATRLVFSLKVADLSGPLPPSTDWYVSFKAPDGVLRGVRMSTDQGVPRFFSYVVGESSGGLTDGRFKDAEGPIEADSNYTAEGVITFVVKATDVGGTGLPGEVFSDFNAGSVQVLGAAGSGAADVVDGMPDGLARTGKLTLAVNGACEDVVTDPDLPPVAGPIVSGGSTRLGGAFSASALIALLALGGLGRRRRRIAR